MTVDMAEALGVTAELEALGVDPTDADPRAWAADHGIAAVVLRLVERLRRGAAAPKWAWPGCDVAEADHESKPATSGTCMPGGDRRGKWTQTWKLLGPLREDRLALVIGPTKRGKTAWALGMAEGAAASNHAAPVLYVSAELGEHEVAARLLAMRAAVKVPWSGILRGQYDSGDVDLAGALLCKECPALYVWTPSTHERDGDTLRKRVAMVSAAHDHAPVLVVLDYLQRFTPPGTNEIRLAVRDVSGGLRELTRPGRRPPYPWWPQDVLWPGACAVVLSSAPRTMYETLGTSNCVLKADTDTLEGAGKECGELEYDATIVAVLTSDPPDPAKDARTGIFRVVVCRDGQPGHVPMAFHGSQGKWTERVRK